MQGEYRAMAAWAPGCDRRGCVEVWSIVTVVIFDECGSDLAWFLNIAEVPVTAPPNSATLE